MAIYEVFRGQPGYAEAGDVLFWILDGDSRIPEFQHVALFADDGPIEIRDPRSRVSVLEVHSRPEASEWPNPKTKYCCQIIGKMETVETPLDRTARLRIMDAAFALVARTRVLVSQGRKRYCRWTLKPYKHVGPQTDDLTQVNEIYFTCTTFVEFCYEAAGCDIVNDGPSGEGLPDSVVEPGEAIKVLFPGYTIRALKGTEHPLDFRHLRERGEDVDALRVYPFGKNRGDHIVVA